MIKPNKKTFAAACFLALMQHNEGLLGKHPNYIDEKLLILDDGFEAFGALDIFRQRTVLQWCGRWNVELPEIVKSYIENPDYLQAYENALRDKI